MFNHESESDWQGSRSKCVQRGGLLDVNEVITTGGEGCYLDTMQFGGRSKQYI